MATPCPRPSSGSRSRLGAGLTTPSPCSQDGTSAAVTAIAQLGDLIFVTGHLEVIETPDDRKIVVRLQDLGALR